MAEDLAVCGLWVGRVAVALDVLAERVEFDDADEALLFTASFSGDTFGSDAFVSGDLGAVFCGASTLVADFDSGVFVPADGFISAFSGDLAARGVFASGAFVSIVGFVAATGSGRFFAADLAAGAVFAGLALSAKSGFVGLAVESTVFASRFALSFVVGFADFATLHTFCRFLGYPQRERFDLTRPCGCPQDKLKF